MTLVVTLSEVRTEQLVQQIGLARAGGAPVQTPAGLMVEGGAEAQRIDNRVQTGRWNPILLFSTHHDHHGIRKLFQAADISLVTSLRQGLNAVAKEFVAARKDQDEALILSQSARSVGTWRVRSAS